MAVTRYLTYYRGKPIKHPHGEGGGGGGGGAPLGAAHPNLGNLNYIRKKPPTDPHLRRIGEFYITVENGRTSPLSPAFPTITEANFPYDSFTSLMGENQASSSYRHMDNQTFDNLKIRFDLPGVVIDTKNDFDKRSDVNSFINANYDIGKYIKFITYVNGFGENWDGATMPSGSYLPAINYGPGWKFVERAYNTQGIVKVVRDHAQQRKVLVFENLRDDGRIRFYASYARLHTDKYQYISSWGNNYSVSNMGDGVSYDIYVEHVSSDADITTGGNGGASPITGVSNLRFATSRDVFNLTARPRTVTDSYSATFRQTAIDRFGGGNGGDIGENGQRGYIKRIVYNEYPMAVYDPKWKGRRFGWFDYGNQINLEINVPDNAPVTAYYVEPSLGPDVLILPGAPGGRAGKVYEGNATINNKGQGRTLGRT